jgi:hypothetical protein
MIRYDLTCGGGHGFDAWFRDSAAYDAQAAAGLVTCAVCGSAEVRKALMAPAVRTRAGAPSAAPAPAPGQPPAPPAGPPALSAPAGSAVAEALTELRRRVEREAEYVGPRFAEEARRIHLGDAAARAIWGEATGAEAKALADDGVPVAPLPFLPRRDD